MNSKCYYTGQMKPAKFFNKQSTNHLLPQSTCLINHIQVQQPILVAATDQMPDHTKITGQQFLAADPSPTFLNTGTTYETLQQSGKQDSFRHLLKSSASM